MRDEELWHADKDRLNPDQRDDRRDTVTDASGPLGFVGFEEDVDTPDDQEDGVVDAAVGNEVESFTEEYAQNEEKIKERAEKDPRDMPERPLPEGSQFRSNRETAKETVSLEEQRSVNYTQDQGTPPDDQDLASRDGAKLTPHPSHERNEPDRDLPE